MNKQLQVVGLSLSFIFPLIAMQEKQPQEYDFSIADYDTVRSIIKAGSVFASKTFLQKSGLCKGGDSCDKSCKATHKMIEGDFVENNFEEETPKDSVSFYFHIPDFLEEYCAEVCCLEALKKVHNKNISQEVLDNHYKNLGMLTTINSRATAINSLIDFLKQEKGNKAK